MTLDVDLVNGPDLVPGNMPMSLRPCFFGPSDSHFQLRAGEKVISVRRAADAIVGLVKRGFEQFPEKVI
ncbi:hypothetical protein PSCICL_40020 [Pseudomonas cichorii]|nr:hypothetical protein PSCICL_40020 [Pseudomonas cichorii]